MMPSHDDIVYAAGILDGEGSVTYMAHNDRKTFAIYVVVANTDIRLISWLKTTFGGKINRGPRKPVPRWKPSFQWRLSARKAEEFLRLVRPFLKLKGDQADIALDIRGLTPRSWGGKPVPLHILDARNALKVRLQELNRKGVRAS